MASTIVEIIDVSEGLNQEKETMQRIETYVQKYPKVECNMEKQELVDGYKMYQVTCLNKYQISLLGIRYTIRASKNTRRVIY